MYVESDTLLLVDVLENFRKLCIKIYELDPPKFLPAPGLAWQAALKKTKVKLDVSVLHGGIRRGKRRNMALYLLICINQ